MKRPSADHAGESANALSCVNWRTLPESRLTTSNSPYGPPSDEPKATSWPSGEKRGALFKNPVVAPGLRTDANSWPFCPKESEIHICSRDAMAVRERTAVAGPSRVGCVQNEPPWNPTQRRDLPNVPDTGVIQPCVSDLPPVWRPARTSFDIRVVGELYDVAAIDQANIDLVMPIFV